MQWGMSINITKCKAMHNGRGNSATIYAMSGRPPTVIESKKYIGFKVQYNLKITVVQKKVLFRPAITKASRGYAFLQTALDLVGHRPSVVHGFCKEHLV